MNPTGQQLGKRRYNYGIGATLGAVPRPEKFPPTDRFARCFYDVAFLCSHAGYGSEVPRQAPDEMVHSSCPSACRRAAPTYLSSSKSADLGVEEPIEDLLKAVKPTLVEIPTGFESISEDGRIW